MVAQQKSLSWWKDFFDFKVDSKDSFSLFFERNESLESTLNNNAKAIWFLECSITWVQSSFF